NGEMALALIGLAAHAKTRTNPIEEGSEAQECAAHTLRRAGGGNAAEESQGSAAGGRVADERPAEGRTTMGGGAQGYAAEERAAGEGAAAGQAAAGRRAEGSYSPALFRASHEDLRRYAERVVETLGPQALVSPAGPAVALAAQRLADDP